MHSIEYWAVRAEKNEAILNRKAQRTISEVVNAYEDSLNQIKKDMQQLLGKYAKDGSISKDEALKLLNSVESHETIESLRKRISTIKDPDIKQELLNRINAPAYRARLTRLQALQDSIRVELKKLADIQLEAMQTRLINTMTESYYRAIHSIQTGTGLGFGFELVPTRAIEKALAHKWEGANYSDRVWRNTDLIAEQASRIVKKGLATGANFYRMTQEIEETVQYGEYAAARVIRTENNYFHNQAASEGYKQAGLERYLYLATLDARTCTVCGALDRKVFKLAEAVVGKNYPPIHPNDRCTVSPYIEGKDYSKLKRRAKDPITGKNMLVPADMTYSEWLKKYVTDKPEAELGMKMARNWLGDRRQYMKYQNAIGKENLPEKLEDFQKMKYTDIEAWEDLKYYVRYIDGRPIYCVKIDRDLYKLGINKGRVYPAVPIKINGWSVHAENRLSAAGPSKDDALKWMEKAKIMLKRFPPPQTQLNYYFEDGILGVRESDGIVLTTIEKTRYLSETKTILEVISKYV